jgi:pSer/pThr/pTyr-binding forkhead associated (FHA) protein
LRGETTIEAMLSLEVRKRAGGAEVHRLSGDAFTVGASSGNEVVVRARGVAGRHVRIFERNGRYHLGLYKGVDAVNVNGHEFTGGPIAPGDRITIGEATITVLQTAPPLRHTPIHELPMGDTAIPVPVIAAPTTEVEYRAMRREAYRICRESASPEDVATRLTDYLERQFEPTEWAMGELSPAGFRPLSSTFLETPALPPRLIDEARAGERVARAEIVTGVLTLVTEPIREGASSVAILVRESPRLPARAILLLEELVEVAGLNRAAGRATGAQEPSAAPPPSEAASPGSEPSDADAMLHQTDDLKKIIETVEREVIDRAMRRVEGNQSRGAEILNISRGSLIAKLKEYGIPDYRYLRRAKRKN